MFKNLISYINSSMNSKFILLLTMIMLSISCRKNEMIEDSSLGINQDKMISFNSAGRIHNQALGFIANNLTYTNGDNYESLEKKSKLLVYDYTKHKNISLENQYIENGFSLRPSIFKDENVSAKQLGEYAGEKADVLVKNNVIKNEEAAIIKEVFSLLEKISTKEINANPISEIDKISKKWETKKFDMSKGEGIVSGYCLSIAKSSVRLWIDFAQKNSPANSVRSQSIRNFSDDERGAYDFVVIDPNDPDSPIVIYDPNNPTIAPMVAPWVAADVAGALGGATGSILSNVFHGKKIDWADAGAWAIGGAVGASTLGPVGKLLTRWFH